MGVKGRVSCVGLLLFIHTGIAVCVALQEHRFNNVSVVGYPLWFVIGYWIGKKYDEALYYSEKDPLTNLYNRRYVSKAFGRIVSFAERTRAKCFIIMVDCDDFKEINDQFDHHLGDQVLSTIGRTLLQHADKNVWPIRWGGDEFLIIGFLKPGEQVHDVVARLETALSETSLPGCGGVSFSVSLGASVYPDQHTDLHQLIRMADQNMYSRKLLKKAAAP